MWMRWVPCCKGLGSTAACCGEGQAGVDVLGSLALVMEGQGAVGELKDSLIAPTGVGICGEVGAARHKPLSDPKSLDGSSSQSKSGTRLSSSVS